MSANFDMLIITPEKTFFDGETDSLVLTTPDGELGILAGHAPLIATMRPSAIRFRTSGAWKDAAVGEGFAQVDGNRVRVDRNHRFSAYQQKQPDPPASSGH